MPSAHLRLRLERHAKRARYAERSIVLLSSAVAVFVVTSLSIPANVAVGRQLDWLPIALAIAGTLLLLGGAGWMVAESKLSGEQISEELLGAILELKGTE